MSLGLSVVAESDVAAQRARLLVRSPAMTSSRMFSTNAAEDWDRKTIYKE
jgi:hypothetical protein